MKTKLIISLILSILSLLYLFLNFYGFDRYFKLNIKSVEFYTEKIKNIPNSKDRIIVVFEYQDKIKKAFINSILDQNIRPDEICIIIPSDKKNLIPSNLKNILTIYGFIKDYKEFNSILYPILKEPDSKTKILILNPTLVYGEDFLSYMIEKSDQNPNKIIYVNGHKESQGILITPNNLTIDLCDNIEKCKSQWLLKNHNNIISTNYTDII